MSNNKYNNSMFISDQAINKDNSIMYYNSIVYYNNIYYFFIVYNNAISNKTVYFT